MKVSMLLLAAVLATGCVSSAPTTRAPLDEYFGYVTVRPQAHMFWVTYSVDAPGDWTDYPLIMWLQGGPGSSGVGYGNFEELGPYYVNQSLREYAWTKKANVMFVDNPVGTGYSYVEDFDALTTNNEQIANDLVTLLKSVFAEIPDMSSMPFFVYAESYGGKMTVDFARALDAAIKNGEIDCDLQGVALGDSWISPMDSVNTWGSFLYNMGFVDAAGQARIEVAAANTQNAVDAGNWEQATNLWSLTEAIVNNEAGGVNFYNVLAKEDIYRSALSEKNKKNLDFMSPAVRSLYERHVGRTTRDALNDLMNGPNKERWNIPDEVVYDSQGGTVFNTLSGDFMKPVVSSVVDLLENTDVYVAVFSGNLDLICDTPGTYRWIENMEFEGKADWEAASRDNFYVTTYSTKAGYIQNNDNFGVYTILRSGHMVPTDAPVEAHAMIDAITYNAGVYKAKVAARKAKETAKAAKPLEKPAVNTDTKVEKSVKPVVQKAKKLAKAVGEKEHEKPKVKKVKDAVKNKVEKAQKEVKVQKAKKEAKHKVEKAKKDVKDAKAKKEVKHKVEEIKKEGKTEKVKKEVKPKVEEIKKEVKAEKVKKEVNPKVKEIKKEVKAEKVKKEVKPKVEEIKKEVKVEKVKKEERPKVEDIKKEVKVEKVKKELKPKVEEIKKEVKAEKVKKEVKPKVKEVKKEVKVEKVKKEAKKVVEKIAKSAVEAKVEKVKEEKSKKSIEQNVPKKVGTTKDHENIKRITHSHLRPGQNQKKPDGMSRKIRQPKTFGY